jgi:hypothetical protein
MFFVGPSADEIASRSLYRSSKCSFATDSEIVKVCHLNLAAGLQNLDSIPLIGV